MNSSGGHHPDFDEDAIQTRADIACDAFEQMWASGKRARIEHYLGAAVGAARGALLRQLLAVEIQFRLQRGESPMPEDYSGRFSDAADVLAEVFDAHQMPTLMMGDTAPSKPRTAADDTATRRDESVLSQCPSFSSLDPEVLAVIEARMHEEHFAAGTALWRQGERAESLVVLPDGEVEISTRDEQGKSHYICRAAGPQVLGEMALLTENVRTADVLAVSNVRVLVLPAETFHELSGRFPQISVVLTHLIARRLGGLGRDVLAGKNLSGYRILRRLGRGGMSVVYHAEEIAAGRPVALKMLSHRLVYDREAYARFQREADIIQSMSHENIVRIYGRFAAFHTCFIVFEYCDGETLETITHARGPLPETDVRKITAQLARALVYAHNRGLVHRDVKPSNVMLRRDGVIKLMDFGLAVSIDLLACEKNKVAGTVLYMAPEQFLGRECGPPADLFALGCLAFQLLTGRHLIPMTDMKDIARRYRTWQTPDIGSLCPELRPEFNRMLMQCLHPDPTERQPDLDRLCSWAAPIDPSTVLTGEAP